MSNLITIALLITLLFPYSVMAQEPEYWGAISVGQMEFSGLNNGSYGVAWNYKNWKEPGEIARRLCKSRGGFHCDHNTIYFSTSKSRPNVKFFWDVRCVTIFYSPKGFKGGPYFDEYLYVFSGYYTAEKIKSSDDGFMPKKLKHYCNNK